jgi:hypothetical protein
MQACPDPLEGLGRPLAPARWELRFAQFPCIPPTPGLFYLEVQPESSLPG